MGRPRSSRSPLPIVKTDFQKHSTEDREVCVTCPQEAAVIFLKRYNNSSASLGSGDEQGTGLLTSLIMVSRGITVFQSFPQWLNECNYTWLA